MLIEMKVVSIAVDSTSNMPFVVLRDEGKKHTLPIWIGLFEASAIASCMENIRLPRPMTHDLMANLLSGLGGSLLRAEIINLKDNTYFAELVLQRVPGEEFRIDARPSDAIALALRAGAPIWVDETVLKEPKSPPEKPENLPENLEDMLKNLSPDAFGKYKQ